MSNSGAVVSEKEWRRQNLEWERRRREAQQEAERIHQRDVDERRARMELWQRQRDEDYKRQRAEEQRMRRTIANPAMAVKVRHLLILI